MRVGNQRINIANPVRFIFALAVIIGIVVGAFMLWPRTPEVSPLDEPAAIPTWTDPQTGEEREFDFPTSPNDTAQNEAFADPAFLQEPKRVAQMYSFVANKGARVRFTALITDYARDNTNGWLYRDESRVYYPAILVPDPEEDAGAARRAVEDAADGADRFFNSEDRYSPIMVGLPIDQPLPTTAQFFEVTGILYWWSSRQTPRWRQPQGAPVVLVQHIEALPSSQVIDPPFLTLEAGEVIQRGDLTVDVERVELAQGATRVYLKVTNNRTDTQPVTCWSVGRDRTLLIDSQGRSTTPITSNSELAPDALPTTFPAGISEGYLVFPPTPDATELTLQVPDPLCGSTSLVRFAFDLRPQDQLPALEAPATVAEVAAAEAAAAESAKKEQAEKEKKKKKKKKKQTAN